MKKTLIFAAVCTYILSGCASVTNPAPGFLYSDVKWDGFVSNPKVQGTKTGRACASTLLGILGEGDASIEAAKADGGIKKVATVDHHSTNLWIIKGEYCTIVTGE